MVDICSKFGDILIYPMYHISDDPLMGLLYYMLLIFFVLNLLLFVCGR